MPKGHSRRYAEDLPFSRILGVSVRFLQVLSNRKDRVPSAAAEVLFVMSGGKFSDIVRRARQLGASIRFCWLLNKAAEGSQGGGR